MTESIERSWTSRLKFLSRLRQIQASVAFRRAVLLNPNSPQAHLEYGRHLQQLDCQDVALQHLQLYRDALRRTGASTKEGPLPAIEKELTASNEKLATEIRAYQKESPQLSVVDRAYAAVQRGLAGRALETLLAADISAFGIPGMKLELDVLLRMGRASEVRTWLNDDPLLRSSLGEQTYYWYLVQSNASLGDYDAANDHLMALSNSNGLLPPVKTVAVDLARAIGQSALGETVDQSKWPNVIFLTLSRNDYTHRLTTVVDELTLLADTLTLKALLALERGDVDEARATFTHLLNHFQPTNLDFNARLVAEACQPVAAV